MNSPRAIRTALSTTARGALLVLLALPLAAVLTLWAASGSTARIIETEVAAQPPQPAGAVRWAKGAPPPESADWLLLAASGVEWRCYRMSGMSGPAPATARPRTWSVSTLQNPVLSAQRQPNPALWNRLGFDWRRATPGGSYFYSHGGRAASCRIVDLPWWSLAVVTALPPATALTRRLRRRRRNRTGRCRSCGYDLRATPGLCPECGAIPPGPLRKATT